MIGEITVALPLILWLVFRMTLPAGPFEMDFDPQVRGTFISLLPHYTRFFYAVALLGISGAVVGWGNGWPVLMLLLAAANALMFNILLVFFYEGYLHARYPRNVNVPSTSNYSVSKYSLIYALGLSSITLLFAGAAWLGWSMSRL